MILRCIIGSDFRPGDDTEPQLLMGIFGEGGTGKSRVINEVKRWFDMGGMGNELLITATSGAAAVKIGGSTLHSTLGLRRDGKANRVSKIITELKDDIEVYYRIRFPSYEGSSWVKRGMPPDDLANIPKMKDIAQGIRGSVTISPAKSACTDTEI